MIERFNVETTLRAVGLFSVFQLTLAILAPLFPIPVHAYLRHFCHQIPSRSFWMSGMPLSLCARCTGLYLGFLVAVALIFRSRKHKMFLNYTTMTCSIIAVLSILLKLIQVDSSNLVRFMFGICLGISSIVTAKLLAEWSFIPFLKIALGVIREGGEITTPRSQSNRQLSIH